MKTKIKQHFFKVLLNFVIIFITLPCFSQGVAINTSGTNADPSAILDISADNAGILIPRITKTQRSSIQQPTEGLMIYQTDDTTGFWYFNGNNWKQIGTTSGGSITAGTSIGNTLYWNGNTWTKSSNIYNNGISVGIGTNNPDLSASLELSGVSKGILINRMNITERNAIQNPALGLQIFNTTANCLEIYITPAWQPVYCGCSQPASPTEGINNVQLYEITWNWNAVTGANGYMYNTINDYNSAIDNGSNTSLTQSGLNYGTVYNLYVWAYNYCVPSIVSIFTDTTLQWTCNNNLIDIRDSKPYQTVQIGSQCWMKENLNFDDNSGNSWCYENNISNCNIYGRLYKWTAAMAGSTSSSSNPSGVQGVCPAGWHLPSDAEWKQIEMYLGMSQQDANNTGWRGTNEGGKLKETGTLQWISPNTGATNYSGFTALPGGFCYSNGGVFVGLGDTGVWWSATEDTSNAWDRILANSLSQIARSTDDKGNGASIRCLKD